MTAKRLLLATSILALTAGGAWAQGGMPNSGTTGTGGGSSSGDYPSNSGGGMGNAGSDMDSSTHGASSSGSKNHSSAKSAASQTSQQTVMRAQQALKDKGLYEGEVDGKLGPETHAAISQFQRQSGLKQSAQLDSQTLDQLEGQAGGGSSRAPGNSSGGGSAGGMNGSGSSSHNGM